LSYTLLSVDSDVCTRQSAESAIVVEQPSLMRRQSQNHNIVLWLQKLWPVVVVLVGGGGGIAVVGSEWGLVLRKLFRRSILPYGNILVGKQDKKSCLEFEPHD
jgi:hypothetical protein